MSSRRLSARRPVGRGRPRGTWCRVVAVSGTRTPPRETLVTRATTTACAQHVATHGSARDDFVPTRIPCVRACVDGDNNVVIAQQTNNTTLCGHSSPSSLARCRKRNRNNFSLRQTLRSILSGAHAHAVRRRVRATAPSSSPAPRTLRVHYYFFMGPKFHDERR